MGPVFFFSHATATNGDVANLEAYTEFYGLLENAVARHVPPSKGGRIGFFDRDCITPGADFTTILRNAITRHPIGVIAVSTAYFANDRPYCRWEYESFVERNNWASRQFGPQHSPILLLNWHHVEPSYLPAEFDRNLQFVKEAIADTQPEQVAVARVWTEGLLNTLIAARSGNAQSKVDCNEFVKCLARHILRLWRAIGEDQWIEAGPPEVSHFDPKISWPQQTSSRKPPAQPPDPGPRKTICVVTVAAKPRDFEIAAPDRIWRYEEAGEDDWRPFAVNELELSTQLHGILNNLISSGRISGRFKPLPSSRAGLLESLKKLEGISPVIFLVDPISIQIVKEYKGTLQSLLRRAHEDLKYISAIVLWNELDPDVQRNRSYLDGLIHSVLPEVALNNKTLSASSVETLYVHLIQEIERLRQNIRNSTMPFKPRYGPDKPTVTATP